ncbi:hypothetical protein GCM10019016_108840 [Streptomyces prasinosporus]|uniref:Uncharacterized protein n=1 Tax=Streptomyces prasinosporus TaxID=68256 RepID=A0ABP6UAW1_9ACTN
MVPLAAMSSLCFCAAPVRAVFTFTGEQPTLPRSALTSSTTLATAPEAGVPPVAVGFGAVAVGFGGVVGFGAVVAGFEAVAAGFGAAAAGFEAVAAGFGAAAAGFEAVAAGFGAAAAGLEADAPGAVFFGLCDVGRCDGSAPPCFGAPVFDALAVAVGVLDGAAAGSSCCRLHRWYQSAPSHSSPAAAGAPWCRPCPLSGQSAQAMATEGMPMTPMATAATTVRRYWC